MHVYVIERPDGMVKIGRSGKPTKRVRNLETAGGFTCARVWMTQANVDEKALERRVHAALSDSREVGEWFSADFDAAVAAVYDAINSPPTENAIEPDLCSVPGRLAYALFQSGLSQQQIAHSLELTEGAISHWMSGRSGMKIEHVAKVADLLGITPSWLAFGTGPITADAAESTAILSTLTPPQRAQALRMLEAFAASCRSAN